MVDQFKEIYISFPFFLLILLVKWSADSALSFIHKDTELKCKEVIC